MPDRVGQQFGNYRLVQLLGQGAFADVYLGEHIYLNSWAAIKVLNDRLSNEDVERFRTEARNLVRLVHPHIVRVLEFGIEEAKPFLVMEYAQGGSLRQRYPKGTQLPLATIVAYSKQIADALQFAHEQKLIHRDVKPENILLSRGNEVLLSDFGLAVVAQSMHYQSTKVTAGTMAYTAPEQIQGHPQPASDQYSLGIIVYEWLCGAKPFQGDPMSIMYQQVHDPVPSLRTRLPLLPAEVEYVMMQALAKEPKQRFATMRAFANALEQASQAGMSQALPPSLSLLPTVSMPQSGAIQTPTEFAISTLASESDKPTELIIPPSNPSISTYLLTLSSQTAVPTELAEPPEDAQRDISIPPDTPDRSDSIEQVVPIGLDEGFQRVAMVKDSPNPLMVTERRRPDSLEEDVGVPTRIAGFDAGFQQAATEKESPYPKIGRTGRHAKTGGRRRLWLIATTVPLVLLLVSAGVFAMPSILKNIIKTPTAAPVPTATVTITPAQQTLSKNYKISAVTGIPIPAKQQVSARLLSFTSPSQSQTVQATGTGTNSGTQAYGQVTFNSTLTIAKTIAAGFQMSTNSGVTAIVSQTFTIPKEGLVTASAYISTTGARGNIPTHSINTTCCCNDDGYGNNIVIYNQSPFSGGKDGTSYTYVDQSDFNNAIGAANQMQGALTSSAKAVVLGQVRPNEMLVNAVQCSPQVSYNHRVWDRVTSVTTSVSVTCKGEVYDQQAALAMTKDLFTQQMANDTPGGSYTPGNIITSLVRASVVDSHGAIALLVNAVGTITSQFSAAQRQELASLIAGKKEQEAQTILLEYPGISQVTIMISGNSGDKLPSNVDQITINVT